MQERIPKKDRMVRKQLFITADQQRELKEIAGRQGVAEADLIRAGIDMKVAQVKGGDGAEWRDRLGALVEGWRNDEDLRRRPDLGDRVAETRKLQQQRFRARLKGNRRQIDGK